MSHIETLDMSHLLLLLDLAHALIFSLGDLGGFTVLPRHLHYELSLIKSQIGSLPNLAGRALPPFGCGTITVCAG
jgi:hypothetical protein